MRKSLREVFRTKYARNFVLYRFKFSALYFFLSRYILTYLYDVIYSDVSISRLPHTVIVPHIWTRVPHMNTCHDKSTRGVHTRAQREILKRMMAIISRSSCLNLSPRNGNGEIWVHRDLLRFSPLFRGGEIFSCNGIYLTWIDRADNICICRHKNYSETLWTALRKWVPNCLPEMNTHNQGWVITSSSVKS